jgi:hypothetical protein
LTTLLAFRLITKIGLEKLRPCSTTRDIDMGAIKKSEANQIAVPVPKSLVLGKDSSFAPGPSFPPANQSGAELASMPISVLEYTTQDEIHHCLGGRRRLL